MWLLIPKAAELSLQLCGLNVHLAAYILHAEENMWEKIIFLHFLQLSAKPTLKHSKVIDRM